MQKRPFGLIGLIDPITLWNKIGLVAGINVSDDGLLLATIAMDKSLKVYDVINFGKIQPNVRRCSSFPAEEI